MKSNIAPVILIALGALAGTAAAQEGVTDDVERGHRLANLICSNCHFATPDQEFEPILRPPAPPFASIAQRMDADAIRTFLATTHRDVKSANGMPNPQLLDFQIRQLAAYFSTLRNSPPTVQTGPCGADIARLETVLNRARADRAGVGSAPESIAARLHRQPTPDTVTLAEMESERNVEVALGRAQNANSQGKDAECRAAVATAALLLGVR